MIDVLWYQVYRIPYNNYSMTLTITDILTFYWHMIGDLGRIIYDMWPIGIDLLYVIYGRCAMVYNRWPVIFGR